MADIKDYLIKFAKIGASDLLIKKTIEESVCGVLPLNKEDFLIRKISDGVFKITTSSVIKNEIILNKKKINQKIKEILTKKAPTLLV